MPDDTTARVRASRRMDIMLATGRREYGLYLFGLEIFVEGCGYVTVDTYFEMLESVI